MWTVQSDEDQTPHLVRVAEGRLLVDEGDEAQRAGRFLAGSQARELKQRRHTGAVVIGVQMCAESPSRIRASSLLP